MYPMKKNVSVKGDQNAQNCPIYGLPKNHWVIALFEIVRSVTKKLLLTVLLDHPVLWCQLNRLSKCLYFLL